LNRSVRNPVFVAAMAFLGGMAGVALAGVLATI
jgi:hypothetical protein